MDVQTFREKFEFGHVIQVRGDCKVNTAENLIFFRNGQFIEQVSRRKVAGKTVCGAFFTFLDLEGGPREVAAFSKSILCLAGLVDKKKSVVFSLGTDDLDHVRKEDRDKVDVHFDAQKPLVSDLEPSEADAKRSRAIDEALRAAAEKMVMLQQAQAELQRLEQQLNKGTDLKNWGKILATLHAKQLQVFDLYKEDPIDLEASHNELIQGLISEMSESVKPGVLRVATATEDEDKDVFMKLKPKLAYCRNRLRESFVVSSLEDNAFIVYVTVTAKGGTPQVVGFMAVDDHELFSDTLLKALVPGAQEPSMSAASRQSCYITVACAAKGIVGIGALMVQQLLHECIARQWTRVYLGATAQSILNWERLGFKPVVNPCRQNQESVNLMLEGDTHLMSRCVFSPT